MADMNRIIMLQRANEMADNIGKSSGKFRGGLRTFMKHNTPSDQKPFRRTKQFVNVKASGICKDWRPCMRKYDSAGQERPLTSSGKRTYNIASQNRRLYDERAHILQMKPARTEYKLRPNLQRPRCDTEINFDAQLGRKIRVPTISKKRNIIPFVKPGDKPYAQVQFWPHYYEQEGLIPGSTNQDRPSTSYAQLRNARRAQVQARQIQSDIAMVENLPLY